MLGLLRAAYVRFGLIGILVWKLIKSRADASQAGRMAILDRQDPESMPSTHKHNFKVTPTMVAGSSIERGSLFGPYGGCAGRWVLPMTDNKMTLFFEKAGDMHTTLQVLPRLLGRRLGIHVAWDERKKKYAKIT